MSSNNHQNLSLFDDQPQPASKKADSTSKNESDKKRGGGFTMATDLLDRFQLEDKGGYITQEFQDFGYRMAVELDDMPHKSLYIKLAKSESRGVLESVLAFVKDSNARNKARLFMWKLKQVREERKKTAKPKSTKKVKQE